MKGRQPARMPASDSHDSARSSSACLLTGNGAF